MHAVPHERHARRPPSLPPPVAAPVAQPGLPPVVHGRHPGGLRLVPARVRHAAHRLRGHRVAHDGRARRHRGRGRVHRHDRAGRRRRRPGGPQAAHRPGRSRAGDDLRLGGARLAAGGAHPAGPARGRGRLRRLRRRVRARVERHDQARRAPGPLPLGAGRQPGPRIGPVHREQPGGRGAHVRLPRRTLPRRGGGARPGRRQHLAGAGRHPPRGRVRPPARSGAPRRAGAGRRGAPRPRRGRRGLALARRPALPPLPVPRLRPSEHQRHRLLHRRRPRLVPRRVVPRQDRGAHHRIGRRHARGSAGACAAGSSSWRPPP